MKQVSIGPAKCRRFSRYAMAWFKAAARRGDLEEKAAPCGEEGGSSPRPRAWQEAVTTTAIRTIPRNSNASSAGRPLLVFPRLP
jgi:hypothetical protein